MADGIACAVLSYRDEPFLVEAVQSLLVQSTPVEVVVINSGGGDPARRLADHGLDVPVHTSEQRLFPGAVRNLGLDLTKAPVVSYLAADCLAMPGWAEARLRAHAAGAAAVASAMTNAYPGSLVAWSALLLLHNRRMTATSPSQRLFYSLSYRRDLFSRFGRFREDLRAGEDTEFNARLSGKVSTVFDRGVLTAHRYPTSLRPMLRDAFRRGGLQARMQGAIEGRAPRRLSVAVGGPYGILRSLDVIRRVAGPERGRMMAALPLVMAGSLAYTAGALTAMDGTSPD